MIEIKKIDKSDKTIRDYILHDSTSFVYAGSRYLRLIATHLNAKESWLVAFEDERLVGVLPFLVKDGPFGPVLNSLAFFGGVGGVIQAKPNLEAKCLLIEAFYECAEEMAAVSATIVSNPMEADRHLYATCSKATFTDERIGQITHLNSVAHPDDLIHIFDDPRPRNIRKAQKLGVKVLKKHEQALNFLYQTHRQNMTGINGLAKEEKFFKAIPIYLRPEDWAIYEATLDGRQVAALLVFFFNTTVEYFTPVILEEFRSTQALALTIFYAMQDALTQGYRNWNWGGTWVSQTGVYNFKKKWGTNEYRYFYFVKVFDERIMAESVATIRSAYPGFFVIPFSKLVD